MRILLVPNTAASMVWFRLPFLEALVAAGHRVWVAAPDGWGVDRIVATGASFVPLFQHQGWAWGAAEKLESSYSHPLRDAELVRDVRRICRVVRPDLVLSYTHKMSVLVPWAARAAGVRRVHGMITGLGYINLGRGPRARAIRAAFFASVHAATRLSDSLILLNHDNVATLRGGGVPADKLFLLDGEGVDTERYAAEPLPWDRGEVTFLMVARLVKFKGVEAFLDAARLVRRTHPGARFLLAGGADPLHPSAVPEATLARCRDEGVVELLGHVDDIRPVLLSSHVFVLPSWETEGLPMSIMEAMAASRPIVTTAVAGNRETVEDGVNGYLVPPEDPEALAAAMRRLLDAPERAEAMGRASRERCVARFAQERVNGALLDHLGLSG
ncbi:MAG TPA: glycosyltransferase family 4 protein [Myxococcota bacterium]|nr:glycosyltransferase family 4 protein [Myxococcota bacterium]